ncbi:MAG: ADP-ribosylation factor-like protein [Promethearchaeota archaeon]
MNGVYKTFLFGLDYAGKTSLSQTIIRGRIYANEKPSVAISFDTWDFGEITFQVWDLPGQISLRTIWKRSLIRTEIFLYILDTSDNSRFDEAREELFAVINDKLTEGMPLIVCLHKFDLEDSKKNKEYAIEALRLNQIKNREVYILETSIYNPDSIKNLKDTMLSIVIKDIEAKRKEFLEEGL